MLKSALLITAIVTSQQTTVEYTMHESLYQCERIAEDVAMTVQEQQEIHCLCVEVEDIGVF